MRNLITTMLAGSMLLFAGHASAADNQMTIAVFTKNRTNPAYEAFRIASDQIARSAGVKLIHLVPNQPDNVDEQKAMVEQALADKPDAVIFIPVDDVAMINSVKKLNDAESRSCWCPIRCPAGLSPMSAPTISRSATARRAISSKSWGARERSSSSKGHRPRRPIASACAATSAPSLSFPSIQVLASGIGNYQQVDARRLMEKFLTEYAADRRRAVRQ